MSNLGLYQDIVTLAKSMGGVDNLIKKIETDAARKALLKTGPVLVTLGALGWAGATKGYDVAKNAWGRYKDGEAAAAEAKDQLRVVVDEAMNLHQDEDQDAEVEDKNGD